jgi:hypothetical protein
MRIVTRIGRYRAKSTRLTEVSWMKFYRRCLSKKLSDDRDWRGERSRIRAVLIAKEFS